MKKFKPFVYRDRIPHLRCTIDLGETVKNRGRNLRFFARTHVRDWFREPFQSKIHHRMNDDGFYIKAAILEPGRIPRRLREL